MSSPGRPPALFGGAHLPERLNDETARKFPKIFGWKNLLTKKNFGWKNYPSRCARAQRAALADYLVEPALRVVVVREALLVGAEGLCVVVAPAVDEARGVLDVKHQAPRAPHQRQALLPHKGLPRRRAALPALPRRAALARPDSPPTPHAARARSVKDNFSTRSFSSSKDFSTQKF